MKETKKQFEILLGVTGGIAAYKSADLCSKLIKQGYGVTVVMTEHAKEFVGELTFSTLSGRKVYTDLFTDREVYDTKHISLTDRSDLIVIAPATANIIAKTANGICDDLLSTLLCGADSRVLMAPAMNERMWHHQATQRNLETLREWGTEFCGPASGRLACGTTGIGRMSEPDEIVEAIKSMLISHEPKGLL